MPTRRSSRGSSRRRTRSASSSSSGSQVDDERAAALAANDAARAPTATSSLSSRRFRPHIRTRGRGAHARRARAGRAGRLAHALRPGHVDAADPVRRPRSDDLRAARARPRARIARRASAPTTRSSSALEPHAGVQAQVYDSVVADRLAMDRVRGYDGPRARARPLERARALGRRRHARRGRAQLSAGTPLVGAQGAAARGRPDGARRPVRAARPRAARSTIARPSRPC